MNNYDNKFDSKTVVVKKDELEEQLRIAEEETIREMSAPLFDPELEAILRETEGYELTPENSAQEQPESKVNEIIRERDEHKKKRVHKRGIVICVSALAILAAVLIGILLVKGSAKTQKYEESFERGQMLYYDGDYDNALEELREALSIKKTDECLMLMSQCYEAKYDYVNAIAILESSNSDDPVIKKRIEMLKTAKEDFESGKIVVICGEIYDSDITVLDLSGESVRSGRLGDLGRLSELTNLKLADNEITTLEFLAPLKKLVSLDLSNNDITDIRPIAKLKNLRTLHLDKNDIEDFSPLYGLSELTTLTICDMEINESQLKELKEKLPGCVIYSDEAKIDIVDVNIGGKTFKSDVTDLDLSDCGLSDISALSVCTKLTKLDLSGNLIKDISPLMDIPQLKTLDLSDNNISDIRPLMGMTSITKLCLNDNNISSVAALTELSKLKTLDLNGNDRLSKKSVDELQKKLPNCKISFTAAATVELGGKSFPVDAQAVDAGGLGISDISHVKEFTGLKTLNLANNAISDISAISALRSLESLDLRGNKISEFKPLYELTALKQLAVSGASPEQIDELQMMLPDCTIIFE